MGFSGHLDPGGVSAPADHIRGPEEVLPSGVGLRSMRHPVHRGGLPGGRGCVAGHLPPVPLSGVHDIYPWEGNHQSYG